MDAHRRRRDFLGLCLRTIRAVYATCGSPWRFSGIVFAASFLRTFWMPGILDAASTLLPWIFAFCVTHCYALALRTFAVCTIPVPCTSLCILVSRTPRLTTAFSPTDSFVPPLTATFFCRLRTSRRICCMRTAHMPFAHYAARDRTPPLPRTTWFSHAICLLLPLCQHAAFPPFSRCDAYWFLRVTYLPPPTALLLPAFLATTGYYAAHAATCLQTYVLDHTACAHAPFLRCCSASLFRPLALDRLTYAAVTYAWRHILKVQIFCCRFGSPRAWFAITPPALTI